ISLYCYQSNCCFHHEEIPQLLRKSASIERVKISNVSANVVHNCEQHMKNNPFEDKKPCIVL
uniref:G protein gamma domain-containing protein n=1 Tax=Callorhinchus milii TaxID=7868 RepID=A0A4W3ICQ6_CALMI